MAEATSKRLDRIEQKLDKLGEALVAIARFEEKMDAYNEYRQNSWERMNKFSEKLDHICLLYTSPSPRDLSTSRMPSSA